MTDDSQPERAVRIALLSDTHLPGITAGDKQIYSTRFERVIEDILASAVDFALVTGDLTDKGDPEQAAEFQEQIRRLAVPARWVPGNHDVGDKWVEGRTSAVTQERVAQYEEAFGSSFFLDTLSGIPLIGINASLLGSGLAREQDQWAFLEEALLSSASLSPLLLSHYPLALERLDEPDDPYWNIEPESRHRLAALLKQGGVRLALSGHLHRPLINQFGSLLCVTAPSVAFGLPYDRQPCGWMLLTMGAETIHIEPKTMPPDARPHL